MLWNRLEVLIQAIMVPLMGYDNKQEGGGYFFIFVCSVRGRMYTKQKVEWVDGKAERGKEN